MFQDSLHRLDSLWLCNPLFQDDRFKFFHDLAVLHELFDESRLHHLTIVGNGIIERYCIDGCYLRLVANTHPWECRLTPIFGTVGGLCVRHADHRWMIAHDRNLQVFMNTDSIEAFNIFRRIAAIELINDIAHANVGTDLKCPSHVDVLITATSPVVIFHRTAMHLHDTAAGMNHEAGIYHTVVECNQEGSYLEDRSRFASITDGIVDHLMVFAIGTSRHVYNSLDVTRLYLHQDGDTHLAIHLWVFQFVNECTFCQVLHTDVNCRDDVISVDRILYGNVHKFVQYLSAVHETIRTS